MVEIKLWIGYGPGNGQNCNYEIFPDVKSCALHAYGQDTDKTYKLVYILKTLLSDKYFHNINANNTYGWKYELVIYDDSEKYENDFSYYDGIYDLDSDEEYEFNNINPDEYI